MTHWLHALHNLRQRGIASVAVTVIATRGSAPREAGTRMIITADVIDGTIGGGNLEFKAIEIARDMLRGTPTTTVRRFPLAASLGQCCGGIVHLLFEPVARDAAWVSVAADVLDKGGHCVMVTALKDDEGDALSGKVILVQGQISFGAADEPADKSFLHNIAARRQVNNLPPSIETIAGVDYFVETLRPVDFQIVLFGAGHVGRALMNVLSGLACHIRWIDTREHEFSSSLPINVETIVTDSPADQVALAQPGCYFLVMTHSHPLDQTIAEAILKRNDFAYFGLIGSLTKRRLFEKRLSARGIGVERLVLMTCPIGIPQISGKDPASIAIAVAAEVIHRRERWVAANGEIPAQTSKTQAPERVSRQNESESRASA